MAALNIVVTLNAGCDIDLPRIRMKQIMVLAEAVHMHQDSFRNRHACYADQVLMILQ